MKTKLTFCILLIVTASTAGCLGTLEEEIELNCEVLPAGHEDDGKLRILSYDVLALSDSMIDEFTNQTGYEVEFIKTDDAGGILDQMMLTKNAQQADLMIGLDNTYLQTAIENCLLRDTTYTNNENYQNISSSAMEPYSGPLAIPFDQGPVCLNFDEDFVDGENVTEPTSLWDLTTEVWQGKTAFPSPITSSPGRSFMVATVDYFANDADETTDAFDWWKAMADNGAIFTSGWTEAYETHYTGGYGEYTDGHIGDAHITVSYCQSPGVEAYYSGNYTHSTSLVLPKSTIQQVEYTGIINGAANVIAAELFIEYLLSPEVNSLMPENNLMYPVLEGYGLPETDGYNFHSDIPQENANINIETINNEMENWLEQWQSATD